MLSIDTGPLLSNWPNWLGIAIGLIGTGIAIFQVVKPQVGARVHCAVQGATLVDTGDEVGRQILPREVEIFFDGLQVPRISRTEILFWNSGTTAIRGEDIVERHPIKFGWEGEILFASLARTTRPANEFTVKTEKNEIVLDFLFLNPGDGARIEVFHTSNSARPAVAGEIVGVKNGVQYTRSRPLFSKDYPIRWPYFLFVVITISIFVLYIEIPVIVAYFLIFLLGVFVLALISSVREAIYRARTPLAPDELQPDIVVISGGFLAFRESGVAQLIRDQDDITKGCNSNYD